MIENIWKFIVLKQVFRLCSEYFCSVYSSENQLENNFFDPLHTL
jgi:hypothetical protein